MYNQLNLKSVFRHIWGVLHIAITVVLIVKWFSKPVNVGQLGQDNIILYVLLTGLFTLISFISYYRKKTIEILIPISVFVLTVITIKIGNVVKKNIERNNQPLITARHNREALMLFKDSTFEFIMGSAEYSHYDRGMFKKKSNQIILDKYVSAHGCYTNIFVVTDTTIYAIDNSSLDTIVFNIERKPNGQ